ncbi:MAG: hypothetical protein A2494_01310 [Candidatus Lloydbacteria bacterium RIFOXYC12_FULL_46_25]|uniref:Uncharacterized protein n=1 Tax=Candidatus Lloydbacteria bacterium RIFOXYC12_FULL_46_25 TaxID=1798670 RepID=A0A1G2E126_9BACT|nr:MAG: hypothetical protein A2494_01310 [Candidatus Lloydbacteria bacterium RIFOXYC12_FULL_46_25]
MHILKKKTLLVVSGLAVVLVIGIVFFLQRLSAAPYVLATVERGDITQEVSASGKVESPTKIDLRFKGSGKLVLLDARVGAKVSAGKLLAKQDTTQLDVQVKEMQAGIDLQKAKLSQLLNGSSPEDVSISETAVLNAEQSVLDAKRNLIDKISGVYARSDDAVRAKSDQLFDNPKTSTPQLIFNFPYDMQLEADVEGERVLIESMLNTWSESLDSISVESDLVSASTLANKNTAQVKAFLANEALIVNVLTSNTKITQATIDKWKTDISSARTNVDTAVSSLLLAEENLRTKESLLKTAKVQLALKTAPVRSSDIAVYQAQITQAEASLEKIEVQRKDMMIYAPVSSVITSVRGEVGEMVGPDVNIVSLASGGALQIKLNVVEDKIVNVRIGQHARITFDAIEDQEFGGKVVAIDPAETIIGGAVYYQATVQFNDVDERIRSGMTANVWINTATSKDTLFVPASAVQDKNGKKIVQVLEGENVVQREVVTGIENDKGVIEILSGISVGEQIILGAEKKKK